MKKYYLAISTGPVVDTLLLAQKTRELWVASYLLSRLMYHLTVAVAEEDIGGRVLAPQPPSEADHFHFGAGIYPDRMYAAFLLENTEPTAIANQQQHLFQLIKAKAIKALVTELRPPVSAGAEQFFDQYFRIVAVWLEETELSKLSDEIISQIKEEEETVASLPDRLLLQPLNDLLDTQELQPAIISTSAGENELTNSLFGDPYQSAMAKLGLARPPAPVESAFAGLTEPENRLLKTGQQTFSYDFFPATADVAALGLYRQYPESYLELLEELYKDPLIQEEIAKNKAASKKRKSEIETYVSDEVLTEFYRLLEKGSFPAVAADPSTDRPARTQEKAEKILRLRDQLLPAYEDYHKYYCLVDVDGDAFGLAIRSLGDDEAAIEQFSQKLANFALSAAATINKYGGKPIFIGGDDMLFLAPVVYHSTAKGVPTTIFDLIEALDALFTAENFPAAPTLSYGLSITHYKYPLFEARNASLERLLQHAKRSSWPQKTQNGTTKPLKKNTIAFRFIRHSGSYFDGYLTKPLLKDFLGLYQLGTSEKFLSSFTYKLREIEDVLQVVGPELDEVRRTALVANLFNEADHRSHEEALAAVMQFLFEVQNTVFSVSDKPGNTRDNSYALLRLLRFFLPQTDGNANRPAHKNVAHVE
ncbi:MAG: type III-B CRISPR-associated protein Cas10/Cmr2 [Bacteroidota bacterium]